MIKHYHFIWRQRCCEVFEWFNLKSNFIPAVVGVFSRDLIILLENPPIFGAASQWSGEIAIFHPHIARNCYISPSYWFSGKRFCGVRIIGIGEPIMSAQEGGMMRGASQMDMRTNIMITCCMDSAYFNLMKWTRKTWRIINKTKNVCLLPSQTSNKNNIYSYNDYTKNSLVGVGGCVLSIWLGVPLYMGR